MSDLRDDLVFSEQAEMPEFRALEDTAVHTYNLVLRSGSGDICVLIAHWLARLASC